MSICYKTLFEVRVLHEYYLTEPDGKNVFDHAAAAARAAFLLEHGMNESRNINQDLEFVVPAGAREQYPFVLLPTYAGFKVCIEVIPRKTVSGVTTYWPKFPLTDTTGFPVLLLRRNGNIDSYSNGRLNIPARSAFYFSNEQYAGNKVFPFLSNAVPTEAADAVYEQGELASFGANDLRAFYRDAANNGQWLPIAGGSAVNESDRLLVPLTFLYAVPSQDNVSDLAFNLLAPDGTPVFQDAFTNISTGAVSLRIPPQAVRSVIQQVPAENAAYTLLVTGNGGFSKTHKLLFYDGTGYAGTWALVHIKTRSANADFDLLNSDGSLRVQRQLDGTFDPSHPVFEIPVRSRLTFWRYINAARKPLQDNLHDDYLDLQDGRLVSKTPRPMSYYPFFFLKPDNTSYFLPNPKPGELLQLEDGKFFSNIYVSNIPNLFPLAP